MYLVCMLFSHCSKLSPSLSQQYIYKQCKYIHETINLVVLRPIHYGDVIMGAIAFQITSFTIVYSAVYSDASQKTSKLLITGLCAGTSPGTGELPAQRASNAEFFSIWLRHHANAILDYVLYLSSPVMDHCTEPKHKTRQLQSERLIRLIRTMVHT